MAARKKKKPAPVPAPRRAARASVTDKVRSLLAAEVKQRFKYKTPGGRTRQGHDSGSLYTQDELAQMLGVSKRTLQRIKANPDYELSPKTQSRIRGEVQREFRGLKRQLDRGAAYVKGQLMHDPRYRLPEMKVSVIPEIYWSKSGKDFTIATGCESWTLDEKISYLTGAISSGRFYAYRIRVQTPEGTVYSQGDIIQMEKAGLISPGEFERVSDFFIVGPEAIRAHKSAILDKRRRMSKSKRASYVAEDSAYAVNLLRKYSDNGMKVVTIFVTEQA